MLQLAAHWADQHPPREDRWTRKFDHTAERGVELSGAGTPVIAEFAHAELAVSLEIHPLACRHLIADALDLRHRLPCLWQAVTADLTMRAWVARKVASMTRRLDATLDQLATALASRGDEESVEERRAKALTLLASPAAALRLLISVKPEAADAELARTIRDLPPDRLAPRAVAYLYLRASDLLTDDDGVVRWEGHPAITTDHARSILGHSNVRLTPVLDPDDRIPADAYEYTGSLREAVLLRTPADCYPYAVAVDRRGHDIDHTIPYDEHGPPGQTSLDNAGPLTRHHHRIKTHGSLAVRQPRPGLYVWRTPHRRYRVTDHRGTRRISHALGDAIHGRSGGERLLATLVIDHL